MEYPPGFENLYISDLYKVARDQFIQTRIRRMLASQTPEEIQDPVLKACYERWGDKFNRPKSERLSSACDWFVTINFKPGVDPVAMMKKMEKTRSKAMLKGSGKYSIEQRSENPETPDGYHIHWILHLDTSISGKQVVQQIYQAYKSHLGGPESIDVKHYDAERHEKYINGDKREEKLSKVNADRVVRQKFGIPDKVEY